MKRVCSVACSIALSEIGSDGVLPSSHLRNDGLQHWKLHCSRRLYRSLSGTVMVYAELKLCIHQEIDGSVKRAIVQQFERNISILQSS